MKLTWKAISGASSAAGDKSIVKVLLSSMGNTRSLTEVIVSLDYQGRNQSRHCDFHRYVHVNTMS